MNLENFANSPSGSLIKVGQGEIAYWAFCPNPLSPPLTWDLPLIKALSAADRALGEDAILRAKQLQDLGYQWRTLLQEKQGTALMYNIIELLLERPILSANDVNTRLGVAHQTAMRTFQRLIDLGILQKVNTSQRNQRFLLIKFLKSSRIHLSHHKVWLVMFGLNGILETAFPSESILQKNEVAYKLPLNNGGGI
ncbi:MAG: hypothetical protein U0350_22330 [Caldilineaceae bacterium]